MDDKRSMPPSIPPNFVTILQLQERWIKQQQQKQNKEQQPEPKPETKPQEEGGIGDVVEEHKSTDAKLESEEVKKNKRMGGWEKWRKKKREARALAAAGAKEGENDVEGEAHTPERKEASVVSTNGGRLRKMSTSGGRGREKEASEGAASLILSQVTAKKREAWKSKRNQRKGEWKKVSEEKVEEEVAGGEAHAPKVKEEKVKSGNADVADQTVDEIEGKLKEVSTNGGKDTGNDKPQGTNNGGHNRGGHRSVEKEERAKSGNEVVVDYQTVEIEGKSEDKPINGGRGRENGRPVRPNNGGYYRGIPRKFENERRREEWKQRNAGMVWVKKRDASGGNAGEVKSSGGSINASA